VRALRHVLALSPHLFMDSTTMCICDAGYFGTSCEKRMCPKVRRYIVAGPLSAAEFSHRFPPTVQGDDALTIGQSERSINIVLDSASTGIISGTVRFTFNGYTIAITSTDFSSYSTCEYVSHRPCRILPRLTQSFSVGSLIT
jgi:hypothetical protein